MHTQHNILYEAAAIWDILTDYQYIFTYGYKGTLHTINLTFPYEAFPHLAGFHYLKDLSIPRFNSSKIVANILNNKITLETIIKGFQYDNMVKPRLSALSKLINILDENFILYSYSPHLYPFATMLRANYLISSHLNEVNYIFITKNSSDNKINNYLCCSIFSKRNRDYEFHQIPLTLLKKEKINIKTKTSVVYVNNITKL